MALFPKPAETQNVGLFLLNKRLIRIAIGVVAFFFVACGLLWRQQYDSEPLPKLPAEKPTPGINETSGYYPYETASDYDPVSLDPSNRTTAELCATFPKHFLGLIQPVLKIGHSEDRAKLDAQLDSVSACFQPDELLIFSDLDERIRNHTAIDILANLPPKYYDEEYNPDISSYLLQRELRKNGKLDEDKEATKKINGWKIDKFKFLPQIERAWLLKPNRPFYFFYETDTYVNVLLEKEYPTPRWPEIMTLFLDTSYGTMYTDFSQLSIPILPYTWAHRRPGAMTTAATSRHSLRMAAPDMLSAEQP